GSRLLLSVCRRPGGNRICPPKGSRTLSPAGALCRELAGRFLTVPASRAHSATMARPAAAPVCNAILVHPRCGVAMDIGVDGGSRPAGLCEILGSAGGCRCAVHRDCVLAASSFCELRFSQVRPRVPASPSRHGVHHSDQPTGLESDIAQEVIKEFIQTGSDSGARPPW